MLAAAGSIWAGLGLVLVVAFGVGGKEGVTRLGRLEVKGGCWASYLRLGHLCTYTSTPVHTRIYIWHRSMHVDSSCNLLAGRATKR
jgi:hypothetical protein